MSLIILAIFAPIILSLLCFCFGRLARGVALLTTLYVLLLAVKLFGTAAINLTSSAIFLAAAVLTLLIILYSWTFMAGKERLNEYYGYLLITLGAAGGVLFASDYFGLLIFWGIVGITLYLLIGLGGEEAAGAARKALIYIGGTDAFMIMGIGLIWLMTRSMQIAAFRLPCSGLLPNLAFFCLMIAALAKTGGLPLHGWIPETAKRAPLPVVAYLPAALDKLLGIYLLIRMVTAIFEVEPNSLVALTLLWLGSLTVMVGVLAALAQHNQKKLLAYHAISQTGYMLVGIGTALPVGLAGALFHMLNNAIYKACLFLTAGAVESKTGTSELKELGGLARFMPWTFSAAALAALAISGLPPFNGFVSKWLIYQGIIELKNLSPFWLVWLTAAMLGSAFTLASFIKLLYATYLGQHSALTTRVREVHWTMWLPMLLLAVLSLIFGIGAFALPLKYFVLPSLPAFTLPGFWQPGGATLLLLGGLGLGLIIYWLGSIFPARVRPPFIGGEILEESENRVTGEEFYETIKNWGPLAKLYSLADRNVFDLYSWLGQISRGLASLVSWLHNGDLRRYLLWLLLGLVGLLLVLVK